MIAAICNSYAAKMLLEDLSEGTSKGEKAFRKHSDFLASKYIWILHKFCADLVLFQLCVIISSVMGKGEKRAGLPTTQRLISDEQQLLCRNNVLENNTVFFFFG